MATTRRGFLKVGALAALALAAGGGIYRLTRAPVAPGPFVLDGEARSALEAMLPAMLGTALPPGPAARAAAVKAATLHVHQAILGLPRATQQELQDLFGLLALGPARRFLAGVPDSWGSASAEQVGAFLQSWRTHRLAMLQTAYHGLHDLIIGAWYADPSNWPAIGYPGPMAQLS
ncbi:twin-arginine translocation signal domain-containing protein [Massilia glaciei]|uniref:Twin-arginine translocation signal domain-containing protein n=1 Tax=Massilia glaciei TaxID=1524097 RepID=A0A2U2HM71_9BURK|nr:twin-arginine translocation signal domain-containing protein [Massilia glaciei]PWF48525.1 hypothetical protein C7C56_011205 [Massilia glaciei]